MTTWLRIAGFATGLFVCGTLPASAGPVTVTIRDGLVTLRAQDATPRQILSEWARVGRVTVVNLERLPGGPITVELVDVPEPKALDIVLRAVGGFVAAPRAVRDGQVSQYDRIFVMTTLAPATAPASATTVPRPMGGSQPFRPGQGFPDQMPNRRGMGGMGAPPDPGDSNDDREDEGAVDEPRPNRPPLGMRPGENTAPPAEAGSSAPTMPMVRPGVLPAPGAATPAGAAKPGQVTPLPQKPPGDIR